MVELEEIQMISNGDEDDLFKSAKKISEATNEELNSATFITAQDALTSGCSIGIIQNFTQNPFEILRSFVFV